MKITDRVMHDTSGHLPGYRSFRAMAMPVLVCAISLSVSLLHYNYYYSMKRVGDFLGVAYIIILIDNTIVHGRRCGMR